MCSRCAGCRARGRGGVAARAGAVEGGGSAICEVLVSLAQLRMALTKNAGRVIDLFREWDEDGDGTVTKKEFRKAMPHLGLEVPKEAIDELFDTIDPDGSGQLSFKELQKALRRTGDAGEKKTATKTAGKPKAKGAK